MFYVNFIDNVSEKIFSGHVEISIAPPPGDPQRPANIPKIAKKWHFLRFLGKIEFSKCRLPKEFGLKIDK